MSDVRELPLTFDCEGSTLVGVLHKPNPTRKLGVVIVVGGPQYRIGSHRQFLLLARDLAAEGFPVLRFDYRGMGDSQGEFVGFEGIDDDIGAAIDTLCREVRGVKKVALWGLCDGATAIAFYAANDERVTGIALVNPWVRSERGLAHTQLRHYYLTRVLERALWRNILKRQLDVSKSAREIFSSIGTALFRGSGRRDGPLGQRDAPSGGGEVPNLAEGISDGINGFRNRVLVILSDKDLTAREFVDGVLGPGKLKRSRGESGLTVKRLPDATHTYPTAEWRKSVHGYVLDWLEADGIRGTK